MVRYINTLFLPSLRVTLPKIPEGILLSEPAAFFSIASVSLAENLSANTCYTELALSITALCPRCFLMSCFVKCKVL